MISESSAVHLPTYSVSKYPVMILEKCFARHVAYASYCFWIRKVVVSLKLKENGIPLNSFKMIFLVYGGITQAHIYTIKYIA